MEEKPCIVQVQNHGYIGPDKLLKGQYKDVGFGAGWADLSGKPFTIFPWPRIDFWQYEAPAPEPYVKIVTIEKCPRCNSEKILTIPALTEGEMKMCDVCALILDTDIEPQGVNTQEYKPVKLETEELS